MAIVMENIKRLREERQNAWQTEGKALADIAAERAFTAEEEQSWERVSAEFDSQTQRIKALELNLEAERAVRDFGDLLADDANLRTALETELRSVLVQRESISSDLEFTGRQLNAVTRALSAGSATAGGNSTAPQFLAELVRPLRNFSSVLSAGARIIVTEAGTTLTVPTLSGNGLAAAVAEAGTLAGTDPTFGQKTLGAFKYGEYVGVSNELLSDSAIDIEELVITLIGENIGAILGQKFAIGAGTTEPTGLITASTVGVTGGAGVTGGFTFDNLIDLHYSVAAPYRVNGSWVLADMALATARKLKDTTSQYLWAPSVQIGQPDLLLGKPVYTDAYMAAPALSAKSVGFGDVSRYWVRFVNSLRVERSDHALFGSDQVAFRGVLRADGALTDANAFKVFQGNAA